MTENEVKVLRYCHQLGKSGRILYSRYLYKIGFTKEETSLLLIGLEKNGYMKNKGFLFSSYTLTQKGQRMILEIEKQKKKTIQESYEGRTSKRTTNPNLTNKWKKT
ncbi:hypothetical protein [Shimazuella kribbensis]|uniref:hypothetical protein n=1 Tax=Shimazuella kribbensis TaxID=139808 RepID=UPI00041DBD1D|nr:hypothetical protein [Shimazuella kribbensis]